MDLRLGLGPAANNVMATFGSVENILSQTPCQCGNLVFLPIINGRGRLSFVCMCICMMSVHHRILCCSPGKPSSARFEEDKAS